MPEPRAFKLRQAESRLNNYTGALPDIDKKRATAVLVRQSKTGADTAQAESRETQLGLQDYCKLLYRDDMSDVRLYDEGAGVSGQKRIDQRKGTRPPLSGHAQRDNRNHCPCERRQAFP